MLKLATWNLQWAAPGFRRTNVIRQRLASVAPAVPVLTEVDLRMLSNWEHVLDAGRHPNVRGEHKRKVAIASQLPMTLVDAVGSPALPPHNFLAVDVESSFGNVRVVGVVVRYNQKAEYVEALPEALEATVTDRTVLAGDFNLKTPAGPLSHRLVEVLDAAGLDVVTAGHHNVLEWERPLMDHIAVSRDLEVADLMVWPRRHPAYLGSEKEVTDHAGCSVVVTS